MKKRGILIAIFCAILGCAKQNTNIPIEPLSNDYQKLLRDSIPSCIKEIESMNWYKYNKAFIHEDNPEFVIKNLDSLNYIIVPSLNIPIDQLSDFQSNILNYLDRGRLSLDNSELLVFEGDTLLLKFSLLLDEHQKIKGIMKSDFNAYLKNSTKEFFKVTKLCFNLTLTDGTAQFPVPTGTFIIDDKLIYILMPNGNLLPVEQMHQLFFESSEELDHYIKNIIGLVQKK